MSRQPEPGMQNRFKTTIATVTSFTNESTKQTSCCIWGSASCTPHDHPPGSQLYGTQAAASQLLVLISCNGLELVIHWVSNSELRFIFEVRIKNWPWHLQRQLAHAFHVRVDLSGIQTIYTSNWVFVMLHVVQFQVWHWACDFFKVARLGWGTCYHLRAASFRCAAPKLGMSKKTQNKSGKQKFERRCAQTRILWSRYTSTYQTYHLCTGGRKQSLKLTSPQIWSLDSLQVAVRTHVDLVISLKDVLPCDSLFTASNRDSRVSLLCRVIICILLCRQQVATGRPSYRGSNSSFHDPPVSKILRQWFALTKIILARRTWYQERSEVFVVVARVEAMFLFLKHF